MLRILFSILISSFLLFAEELDKNSEPNVNCLILEDENSIICKFKLQRALNDRNITVQWINPQGEISREREMIIPARHASIYDYRYVKGRESGKWTFNIILEKKNYSTTFDLK